MDIISIIVILSLVFLGTFIVSLIIYYIQRSCMTITSLVSVQVHPHDPENVSISDDDSSTDENKCCICLCTKNCERTISKIQCGHSYHKACLIGWFKVQLRSNGVMNCPICRSVLRQIVHSKNGNTVSVREYV